jgi:hypothetical protein
MRLDEGYFGNERNLSKTALPDWQTAIIGEVTLFTMSLALARAS